MRIPSVKKENTKTSVSHDMSEASREKPSQRNSSPGFLARIQLGGEEKSQRAPAQSANQSA
jgi:hypothetical protein